MRVPPPGADGVPEDAALRSGELFTDRRSQAQVFAAALAGFRRQLSSDGELGPARHNVLVFHGLGGIGKTALSERLQRWCTHALPADDEWGRPPATRVDATVRIDLHGSAGHVDLLTMLVALRSAVGSLRRRWPAFDLAFAAYWSAVRPGEPFPFRGDQEAFGTALSETVRDALNDLGALAELTTGTVTGLGTRGVRKLLGVLRAHRDRKLTIGVFPGFEQLLLRCADEPSPSEPKPALVSELAATLSWELAAATPCPLVVTFVDTTERLATDLRRVAEAQLNDLVHRMPNVLFVLTGRNALDWHDARSTQLPHRGALVWPELLPRTGSESHQHLVGVLAPEDTRALVRRARLRLNLPMSEHVADELVLASGGLPQYVELACQVALSVRNAGTGAQVSVADVTGSLGSLVQRVLDDLPADEQRVVRAACLFRTFDTGLIAAAAGVDHGCALRAVRRPVIERHDDGRFPYRMHDAVREAIRRVDHHVPAGWAEPDWELAASRGVAAVRSLHDAAKAAEDYDTVLDALGIAIRLVCEQQAAIGPATSPSYSDWLAMAIAYGPSMQGLRPRVPGSSHTGYGRMVLDFITARCIETPAAERLALLRGVFDSAHPLRLSAGRHLSYTLRLRGQWAQALAVCDEVTAIAPTPLNRSLRSQVLSLARRFGDALAAADTDRDSQTRRIVAYLHGDPQPYFTEIDPKIAHLRRVGRHREYLEDEALRMARRVLFCIEVDAAEIEACRDSAERIGQIVAIRDALLATVLHRTVPAAEISAALQRLKALDQAAVGAVGFRWAHAEFCDAMLAGSTDRLTALRDEINLLEVRNRSWIPVECFLDAAGLPTTAVPTQWLEPYDVVQDRWAAHLRNYLAHHRPATT